MRTSFTVTKQCPYCFGTGRACPDDCGAGRREVSVMAHELTPAEIERLRSATLSSEQKTALDEELRLRAEEEALDAELTADADAAERHAA